MLGSLHLQQMNYTKTQEKAQASELNPPEEEQAFDPNNSTLKLIPFESSK